MTRKSPPFHPRVPSFSQWSEHASRELPRMGKGNLTHAANGHRAPQISPPPRLARSANYCRSADKRQFLRNASRRTSTTPGQSTELVDAFEKEGFFLGGMSGPGSISQTMANGLNAGARMPQNSAELVGSQFVSQFYTILHSSPHFLHRFYTDESTVTHADGGSETEGPSCITVTTQKNISERVQAMGFQEATTEIWSVDSQYSKDNGVMVLVTGSLQCKGKKKRDFVQSFFLAVQEKGYFVLNDTFRYLSLNHSRQNSVPKENGYHQSPYDSRPYSQSGYHQQSYYPTQPQAHNPQAVTAPIYSTHPAATGYATLPPAAPASTQPRPDISRGHAVTPSMLPSRPVPQPPKPVGPSPQPTQQAQQAQSAPSSSTAEVPPLRSSLPDAEPRAVDAPTGQPPAQKAKPEATVKQPEVEAKPSAPATQPKAIPKPEAKEVKAERLAEEAPPREPSAPLTYADRLKLGSKSVAPKLAPSPSPVAPTSSTPAPNAAPHPAPAPAPKPAAPSGTPEAGVEALLATAEAPEPSTTAADIAVTPLPDDTLATSIFVKSLPEGTTPEKLEEAFARFGNIKSVSLRQQPKAKGDFAFVEFEEVAAMQAAIEAKVIIDGKAMTVMERRPMLPKHRAPFPGGERGGRGEGRGFRGRDNRGRGRGEGRPYTGGRSDRGEGREGGGGRSGRSFSGNFGSEPRQEGAKPGFEGRPEGGRGRGEGRGRGRNSNRGPPPVAQPPRVEQA